MSITTCTVCGETVPEGRQICWVCEVYPRFNSLAAAIRYARLKKWTCYELTQNGVLWTVREKEGAGEYDGD